MGQINIANSSGRDALVSTQSVRSARKIRWVDDKGRQASSARIIKAPVNRDIESLNKQFGGLAEVAAALVESDPEIAMDCAGRFLSNTSRVYINRNREIVHKVEFWENVRNPDGSLRERRPRKEAEPNLASELPLRWSGVFIDKDQAARKFVFSGKLQLHHINGLTYDFLFGMAKELEEKNSLMLIGSGPKSNQPLILRRGSTPYRGFLEGRTAGDKYCLILHFSNMELKSAAEGGVES